MIETTNALAELVRTGSTGVIVPARLRAVDEACPVCGQSAPPHQGIYVDVDKNTVLVDGVKIKLPAHQAKVLSLLVKRRGRSVRREAIHQHLYYMDIDGGPDIKILDIYICHLRKHLRPTRAKIVTHWGIGFSLEMDGA